MDAITLDKIQGVMYGQAIGDALGVGAEFLSKAEAQREYPTGLRHYSQLFHEPGSDQADWTDDTDQMLCIMDSILTHKTVQPLDIARRIYQWAVEDGTGIGYTVSKIVYSSDYLEHPQAVAERIWVQSGKDLAPNGAIMRTSILGVWQYTDPAAVARNTEAVCRITHADPRCVESCICLTALISALLRGENDLAGLIEAERRRCQAIDSRIEEYFQRAARADIGALELDEAHSIGYTLKALGAALWAIQHGSDFQTGLLAVINEAGDADTNAAVAGALLGARYGLKSIPPEWIEGFRFRRELDERIERLIQLMDTLSSAESLAINK